MFIVNDKDTRTSLISFWCFYSWLWKYFTPFAGQSLEKTYQLVQNLRIVTDTYAMVVLKDTPALGHLSNGKTGRYAKTIFYFLPANHLNTAVIVKREELILERGKACKFPARLNAWEKKIYRSFKRTVKSIPISQCLQYINKVISNQLALFISSKGIQLVSTVAMKKLPGIFGGIFLAECFLENFDKSFTA